MHIFDCLLSLQTVTHTRCLPACLNHTARNQRWFKKSNMPIVTYELNALFGINDNEHRAKIAKKARKEKRQRDSTELEAFEGYVNIIVIID